MGSPIGKKAKGAEDEVTYFFLIKTAEKGAVLSATKSKKERVDVTNFVQKEGGQCHLYSTRGAAYDFVSVITGVTIAAAVRIAEEIEKGGNVKATLISGLEMF
jgi:uncharacterized protein with GYD domain